MSKRSNQTVQRSSGGSSEGCPEARSAAIYGELASEVNLDLCIDQALGSCGNAETMVPGWRN